MKIREIMEQKRKWRAHARRVKLLPRDYRIVYGEIQKYLFKLGPADFEQGMDVLAGIADLMEEGAAAGKDVLDVTGKDIAAFCDELTLDMKTFADAAEEAAKQAVAKSMASPLKKKSHSGSRRNGG